MRWIFPARLPDPRDFPAPVHDGDTLYLTIDRGYGDRSNHATRLSGVYAPELGTPGGLETHRFVLGWLEENIAELRVRTSWPLYVETFTTKTGRDITTLGRYVAMVYAGLPTGGPGWDPPCLNLDLQDFLVLHPEWGGGIGT